MRSPCCDRAAKLANTPPPSRPEQLGRRSKPDAGQRRRARNRQRRGAGGSAGGLRGRPGQRLRDGRLLPRSRRRALAGGGRQAGRRGRRGTDGGAGAGGRPDRGAGHAAARHHPGGWLAGAHPRRLSPAGDRPPLRGARHAPSRVTAGRADHAHARCRPRLRVRRARLDPRLPARAGARGVPPATADPGSGHRLRHPGDGGSAAAAPARAGDRHRPLVGAGRPPERGAQPPGTDAALPAGGRVARPGGARRRPIRPGAGEHPGAAAVPDGPPAGGAPGTRRHRDPGRPAGEPGAPGPGRAPPPRAASGGGDRRGTVDDAGPARRVAAEESRTPPPCHGRAWPGHPRLFLLPAAKSWMAGSSPDLYP